MDEYLKRSGLSEIVVVVRGEHNYLSEEEAQGTADSAISRRNETWDDRQGLFFLRELRPPYEVSTGSSGRESDREGRSTQRALSFTQSNFVVQSEWDYTIDTLSRAWLPASLRNGASENAGRSEPEETDEYTIEFDQSPLEVVSLAEVKRQVGELDAKIKAGAGVPGFRDCMHYKILGDRHLRADPSWTPREARMEI